MSDKLVFGLYQYKGKLYYAFEAIEMKNSHTRKWEIAVVYISVIDRKKYVREVNDFLSKFIINNTEKEG